ncbi:hypothetical protein TSAR_004848 [Trichomalopsis sarcophagae]|uniref:Peptidase S1 domain-containing protein n=1 Tax=Trichomalopsis sarcophagae TaxID=543379 RepID=A0A232FMX4_9HYME|nr:hypothetical protein TSAR_004848 [Trichomalopsis sarcophagae]
MYQSREFIMLVYFKISKPPVEKGGTSKNGIIGGEFTVINTAQILLNKIQDCGEAILSEYWVVILLLIASNGEYTVITGSSVREVRGQRHRVEKVIIHEDFDNITLDNDIALIQVEVPKVYDKVYIAGYGKEGAVVLPIYSKKNISCIRESEITDNMFCAGAEEDNACQGDSGGPAVINNRL